MSIFTILTYAMLTLVMVAGAVALLNERRIRSDRRAPKPRFLPAQTRRVLPRA